MSSRMLKRGLLSCLILAAGSVFAADLSGAGATFPAPVYKKWGETYRKHSGLDLNYQAIGSGDGIRLVSAKAVDFGASDMPLTAAELDKAGLAQFPMLVSGIVPIVNVEGVVANALRLDGQTLGAIYLGKITRWNDPAITALNPGISLPNAPIAVIHRGENSGSTFIFTNYLSKVSAEWKATVGEGITVRWKTGTSCWSNQTMPICVERTPNSIGYVDYGYATKYRLCTVQLKNHDGKFVAPSNGAFKAAAEHATWDPASGFYEVLTDQGGNASWPLAGATYILLSKVQSKPDTLRNVLKFFDWAYTTGGPAAAELGYVPIPDEVQQRVREAWVTQVANGAIPARGATMARKEIE